MKFYTGIGSRQTPKEILDLMVEFGKILAKNDYVLRSGGANGADSAFEKGCDLGNGRKEIYLPWPNFNNHNSNLNNPSNKAYEFTKYFHPAPDKLTKGAMKLHSRNAHQVLGVNLDDPSDFIVCWTKHSGGTQQALRIGMYYEVPIYNLYYDEHLEEFKLRIGYDK